MPSLDKIRKGLRPSRALLEKTKDKIVVLLKKADFSEEDMTALSNQQELLKKYRRLLDELDAKLRGQLTEESLSDEEENLEYDQMELYLEMYMNTNRDVERFMSSRMSVGQSSSVILPTTNSVSGEKKRRCMLPEVKIQAFSGELTDWISWWTQYRKVHDDDELPAEDKFHYLKQSLVKGSEAHSLVESYPMSAENYEAAVKALTDRYGRKDLLLQVYIRELLSMAITQASGDRKESVSQLVTKLRSRLQALAALDFHKADPAILIYPLVESNLSDEVLKAWQRSPEYRIDGSESNPKKSRLDLLLEFLEKEARDEQERIIVRKNLDGSRTVKTETKTNVKTSTWKPRKMETVPTVAGLFNGTGTISCYICRDAHFAENCPMLKNLAPERLMATIKEKKLCFRCLTPGHRRNECKKRVCCNKCKRAGHLGVFCFTREEVTAVVPTGVKRGTDNKSGQPSQKRLRFVTNSEKDDLQIVAQNNAQCSAKVLLNTIKVKLDLGSGDFKVVRLVGDSCSQRSFGKQKVLRDIGENPVGEEWLQTIAFGAVKTVPQRYLKRKVNIMGFNGVSKSIDLLEKDTITGEIREIPYGRWIEECATRGIEINDVGDGWSDADILVGNDYWGVIRTGNIVQLSCGLTAEETIFGWTLGGPLPCQAVFSAALRVVEAQPQTLDKLWSLESIGIRDPVEKLTVKEEEEAALKHFEESVKRNKYGAYVVALPWKSPKSDLPTNRKVAEARLKSTTYKLKAAGKLEDYHGVFATWEMEGLITRMNSEVLDGHYIPHRPVFKQSETTPVRPVYDASCRQGRSPSLNDCLYKGPNLIELIPSLLLRFGNKKIGATADIRKAFQMLEVTPDDKPFQRFLWWESTECEKMVVYEHNRVVFGITSSPFLLGASIRHHLNSCGDNATAKELQRSFYVDNLVTSVDDQKSYEIFRKEACELMASAKMELRQWGCTGQTETEGSSSSELPLLGLLWNTEKDSLSCVIKKTIIEGPITKRTMMSVVAQVFDPMGYLAPAMLFPKALVQVSWEEKCGWDEPVPPEVACQFEKWMTQMQMLSEVRIPRWRKVCEPNKTEVHVFCDSSNVGMAAVAFLKTSTEKESRIQFLMCKARLTPLAKTTIPRLELISCVLGVRIARTISEALELSMDNFTYWSDSSTALAWIRKNGDWGVFVRNRVNEILASSREEQWRHVPGVENPADLPSRGCSPRTLIDLKWWEGPKWLNSYSFHCVGTELRETCSEVALQANVTQHPIVDCVIPRCSSYRKLIKVWGWVLRFTSKCRQNGRSLHCKRTPFLTHGELRYAEKDLLGRVQVSVFGKDCKNVGGIEVVCNDDGLLRVKSRLGYRDDEEDFIYPIVLPRSHCVVDLLIKDVHFYYGHGGIQFLLIPPLAVDPAPLPPRRVNNGEVYQTTEVDLAGPLFLKSGDKVWIVVFTCAVFRAVHLDLVRGLSTEDFILALERFISLYGRPNTVYSDNGTNFVGAVNLFRRVDWNDVEMKTRAKMINWIFNPPTAAWWGGWWERVVRMVKELLKRMLGRAKLNYDELRTCLAGVEATINERPLTVVTEDSMDLVPLTPSMFIRPKVSGHFPELEKASGLRARYAKMKNMQKAVEERFRKEYLALLVNRCGKAKQSTIEVGDIVLVGADNRKRYEWPMGRVIELCPGRDDKARLAKVKTASGILCRPLQRLYPMEISNKEQKQEVEPVSETVDKFKKTRAGRVVKPPSRYGQWAHLVVLV